MTVMVGALMVEVMDGTGGVEVPGDTVVAIMAIPEPGEEDMEEDIMVVIPVGVIMEAGVIIHLHL